MPGFLVFHLWALLRARDQTGVPCPLTGHRTVRLGQVRLKYVRVNQGMFGQSKLGYVWLEQGRVGQVNFRCDGKNMMIFYAQQNYRVNNICIYILYSCMLYYINSGVVWRREVEYRCGNGVELRHEVEWSGVWMWGRSGVQMWGRSGVQMWGRSGVDILSGVALTNICIR